MSNDQTANEQRAKEAMVHFRAALALTKEKNFRGSVAEYEQAADIFPPFFEALDNAGFDRMELDDLEGAKKDFERSLAVNPEGYTALCKLGECFKKSGDSQTARTYFEKAAVAASNPKDAEFANLSAASCN